MTPAVAWLADSSDLTAWGIFKESQSSVNGFIERFSYKETYKFMCDEEKRLIWDWEGWKTMGLDGYWLRMSFRVFGKAFIKFVFFRSANGRPSRKELKDF